ncbi:MAG: 50S ribosomal protein L24 [Legionella sp.]|jgi:large subunit ribosomal protein L24|nr:50S ribosomal protein L24 [Legionella sp.]
MKRIKKDDTVIVTTGKSKGHIGKVLRILGDKLIVEGANLVKKHVKANPQKEQRGEIRTQEAMLHISNVALYDLNTKKAGKVGFRFVDKDGVQHKERYFKSSQDVVDQG